MSNQGSSEYFFGLGSGHLDPDTVGVVAEENGATLVNYTGPECFCGYGCSPHTCEKNQRNWFACRNLGEPFNSSIERVVMAEVSKL